MANYRNVFPNLTGADFLAAASSATNANEAYVYDWAQHGNTDRLPANKIPNIAIGDVHVILLTNAQTADDGGTPAISDVVTLLNSAAGAALNLDVFHEGDTAIVTGTTSTGTTGDTLTLIYVTGGEAGKTPGSGAGFIAGDFRQIATSATGGVTSLTADNSLTVSASTGAVTINLDNDIHAAEAATTFTVGRATDGASSPTNQATAIAGTGITVTSTGTGELDITSGGAVDINAGGTSAVTIDGASVGATGSISSTVSSGSASISATASGNVAAVSGTTVNVTGVTGITGNTTVTGTFTSTSTTILGSAAAAAVTVGNATGATTINGIVSFPTEEGVATAGNITTTSKIAVLGSSGALEHRTLGSIGVGAYTATATQPTNTATQSIAVTANSYVTIPRQSQNTTITFTGTAISAAAAGSWIKIFNKANLANAQDVTDGDATVANSLKTGNLRTVTLAGFTASTIAGAGADTTLVLDDFTANFELIFDGAVWNVFTT